MSLSPAERRQFAWITIGAVAVFAALRLLPTGTNLSHMDFRVDPRAGNAIEFCDPANPQFIPVVAAKSPVAMTIALGRDAVAGSPAVATVRLATTNGKPLRVQDLLVTHTERLHLLIVDPALRDYQHVHPTPTGEPGEWRFTFTPSRGGTYRFFADFTPAATGRGLYASADHDIASRAGSDEGSLMPGLDAMQDGHRFTLGLAPQPARAGRPIDLRFAITRTDGGAVALKPVMDAYAHLVAFDEARSGFAHLHPVEADLAKPPAATNPVLNFKLTIPRAGRYLVWAQVNLGGLETFVPFGLNVAE
ncbi:MAG: hypothetical protein JNK23_14595 [Opitutaceae bacterium]|nr:hypothetical protein [Opitutaceae bacterium]